jgi:hypothetical protein
MTFGIIRWNLIRSMRTFSTLNTFVRPILFDFVETSLAVCLLEVKIASQKGRTPKTREIHSCEMVSAIPERILDLALVSEMLTRVLLGPCFDL